MKDKIPMYGVKKERKKKLPHKKKSFVIKDGKIYEQIWDIEKGSKFVTLNNSEPKYFDSVEEFSPIKSDAVEKGVVLLPDGLEEYGSVEKLIDELRTHIHKYLDISEDHEIFASYYILLTWVYDKTSTINYMSPMGDWGTGKSRYLDTIGRLCYKPIILTGALTTAPVFRLLDMWKGTLIIDEGDFKQSDEHADIMKIINSGFEKSRAFIPRCNPNDPSIIDIFCTFGPKIIGRRKRWKDQATESRTLTERMQRTGREDIPPKLPSIFFEEEKGLRRKLLKFRFDFYNKISDDYIDLGIPGLEPRLKQAVAGFTVLFANIPKLLERFKIFVKKYNEELIEDRAGTYEGMIIQSFVQILMDGKTDIMTKDVVDKIKDEFNQEYSTIGVSKTLKSMGFDIKVERVDGRLKRILKWEKRVLLSVTERYLPIDHDFRSFNGGVVTDVTLTKVVPNQKLINNP